MHTTSRLECRHGAQHNRRLEDAQAVNFLVFCLVIFPLLDITPALMLASLYAYPIKDSGIVIHYELS